MRNLVFVLVACAVAGLAWQQPPIEDYVKQGNAFMKKNDFAHAIEAFTNSLRLDPNSASSLYLRGLAYYRSYDDDHAIQDYTAAIRLNPELGEAFEGRADAYVDKLDYGRAIEDYTGAIGLLHKTKLRHERAFAYEHAGQYGPAIADFTESIVFFPRGGDGYRNRGRLRLYAGYIPDAQRDLTHAVDLDPRDYYSVIWLYIARMRGTTPIAAPSELEKNAAKLNLAKWPGPVISLFLGKSTLKPVLRAASDKDAQTGKEQQCEANFYIAEYQALHGQSSAAAKGFHLVEHTCPKNYFFYLPAARAELKGLP